MNSDPNLDALLAELKADLPSERDSSRLRTRLAALGIAAVHGVAGSAAAATATGAATTAAAEGGAVALAGAAQASISVMALKTFVVALVAGGAVTSSAWYVAHGHADAPVPRDAKSVVAPILVERAANQNSATQALPAQAALELNQVEQEPSAAGEATARQALPTFVRGESAVARERVGGRLAAAPALAARQSVPSERAAEATANARPASPPATPPTAPLAAEAATSTAAFAALPSAPAASVAAAPVASAPVASAPAERAVEATTLRAETLLIDRALSALRASDTTLAARLLAQHRARFPDGLLKRERERAERKLAELETGRGTP